MMKKNIKATITFSSVELQKLEGSEHSCVEVENRKLHLTLLPFHLTNIFVSVNEILSSYITKYNKDLQAIVLGYKNVKILDNAPAIFNDNCFIHVNIEADFYLFKPSDGKTLVGIVNQISDDHIGCLVHKAFNIVIPKEKKDEWCGKVVKKFQHVLVQVTYANLEAKLPYIKAKFLSVVSDSDSGISTGEENCIDNSNINENITNLPKKNKLYKKSKHKDDNLDNSSFDVNDNEQNKSLTPDITDTSNFDIKNYLFDDKINEFNAEIDSSAVNLKKVKKKKRKRSENDDEVNDFVNVSKKVKLNDFSDDFVEKNSNKNSEQLKSIIECSSNFNDSAKHDNNSEFEDNRNLLFGKEKKPFGHKNYQKDVENNDFDDLCIKKKKKSSKISKIDTESFKNISDNEGKKSKKKKKLKNLEIDKEYVDKFDYSENMNEIEPEKIKVKKSKKKKRENSVVPEHNLVDNLTENSLVKTKKSKEVSLNIDEINEESFAKSSSYNKTKKSKKNKSTFSEIDTSVNDDDIKNSLLNKIKCLGEETEVDVKVKKSKKKKRENDVDIDEKTTNKIRILQDIVIKPLNEDVLTNKTEDFSCNVINKAKNIDTSVKSKKKKKIRDKNSDLLLDEIKNATLTQMLSKLGEDEEKTKKEKKKRKKDVQVEESEEPIKDKKKKKKKDHEKNSDIDEFKSIALQKILENVSDGDVVKKKKKKKEKSLNDEDEDFDDIRKNFLSSALLKMDEKSSEESDKKPKKSKKKSKSDDVNSSFEEMKNALLKKRLKDDTKQHKEKKKKKDKNR